MKEYDAVEVRRLMDPECYSTPYGTRHEDKLEAARRLIKIYGFSTRQAAKSMHVSVRTITRLRKELGS